VCECVLAGMIAALRLVSFAALALRKYEKR
jgi:hypothetical protein